MNWDDLRVARAVFQTGSYAAAARLLGINETTVPRRLLRLEKDLHVTLFEAVKGTRRPTAYCEEIMTLSESIAVQAERITTIANSDLGVLERRRIAATDSITAQVLAPRTASLLSENPGLALDYLVSTENVDFSRWEADIAIRLRRPEKGDFIISKIADLELLYIEPANPSPDDELLVCAYSEELEFTPESQQMAGMGLLRRARCRTKNLLVLKQLIQTGQFCGVLPGFICTDLITDSALRFTKLPQRRDAWLLVQRHHKNDKTTRKVTDWIRKCFASMEA